MISIANADNDIHPEEIKILKKIYKFLGFAPESIYSDIHKIQTYYAKEPVIIKRSEQQKGKDFKIPEKAKYETKQFSLNPERIDGILKETDKVVAILAPIFQESENISPDIITDEQKEKRENIADLDAEHSAIVRQLIKKEIFPRAEFEDLCDTFGLLPNGVIETINESFYKYLDDSLIEDENDLIINKDIAKDINNEK
jgi:hypothetical protein